MVPKLNFRLAHPDHLIDINHLEGESTEPEMNDRWVTFDPLVRNVGAERSAIVEEELPLLFEALHYVAHPAIRTPGRSLGVWPTPIRSGIPAVLTALGGEIVTRSAKGQRTVHSDDCFVGPLVNALEHDEWMEAVRFPRRGPGEGFAFEEFSRRSGDYALCGVAAVSRPTPGGMSVSLAYLGVGVTPQTVEVPPTHGRVPTSVVPGRTRTPRGGRTEAVSDIHATGAYKGFLAVRLGTKAARRAVAMGVPA